jgi:hypothetical protein
MGERREHRVVAFVTGEAGEHLEALRRRWDPDMADQIAGHVTIAYRDEAPDLALLTARVEVAARRIPPFPLRLGEIVAHEAKASRGIYHLVDDPVGVWTWLREFLVAPPFVPLDVVPHATIAHPRTALSLRRAWKVLAGSDPDIEFRVGELHLVAHDGERWVTADTFPLSDASLPAP